MQTIYRATDNPIATKGAHFAQAREDAEAYLDNPGYGGATVYEYSIDDSHVLHCDSVMELAELWLAHMYEDDIDDLARQQGDSTASDLVSLWTSQGISYIHDALDQVDGLVDMLAGDYDWIVFVDSYPDDCITWRYLETAPISPVA